MFWAKKIRGELHYFGKWDDPDGAEKKYLEQKEALHAGRKPRESTDGYTVKMLCNDFLFTKEELVKSGELTQRSWDNALSPSGARSVARFVVLNCYSLCCVARMEPHIAGPLLLALLGDLQEVTDLVPVEGWELCVGSSLLECNGVLAASAHQTAHKLAKKFFNVPWDAARQASFERWGEIAADWFIPASLFWNDMPDD